MVGVVWGIFLRLMPWLSGFLLTMVGSIASRALSALGIGYISYQALNPLVNIILGHVESRLSDLNPLVFQLVNMAGLSAVVSILGSALITKATLMAVNKFAVNPLNRQMYQ